MVSKEMVRGYLEQEGLLVGQQEWGGERVLDVKKLRNWYCVSF